MPLTCVRNGCWMSHHSDDSHEFIFPTRKEVAPKRASGTCAITSQLFVLERPVLTPPWSWMPLDVRALTLMSIPFQCSVCVPYFSASVVRLSWSPNFEGTTS